MDRRLRAIIVLVLPALGAVELFAQYEPDGWHVDSTASMGDHPVLGGGGERGVGNPVAACSGPPCGYECRSEGFFFNVDIPILTVWQDADSDIASQLIPLQNPGAAAIGELDPNFDPSVRAAIGWHSDDNWGGRVRYWEFDTFAAEPVPPDAGNPNSADLAVHDWHVSALDAEVVLNKMTHSNWDTTFSLGYRYLRFQEAGILLLGARNLASVETSFPGHGITGSAEFRRQFRPRLGFVANARLSFVGGRETVTFTGGVTNPIAGRRPIDGRFVYETQVGMEYIHPICGHGYAFVRGGAEIQYWDEFVAPVRPTGRSHVMLGGFLFSVGWQR